MILSSWAILGVQPPAQPWAFVFAFIVGYAAVLGISLINAALARNAAAATSAGTVIFMVLMLFAGAFLPRFMLPEIMVRIGDDMPPGVKRCWLRGRRKQQPSLNSIPECCGCNLQ